MNNLYQILDDLRELLLASPFTNEVTFGQIDEVDLNKKTNFPLVHLNIEDVVINETTIDFNLNLIACDILDVNKEIAADKFLGNNNMQDILNTQLSVVTDVSNFFRRGDLRDNNFMFTEESVLATPFLDDYENQLAGWESTITIRTRMQDKC